MVTTLRILGDEQFLPIDAETRAALGISEETPLDLKVEDGRLTVAPATPDLTFEDACEESLKQNAELYRRLA